MEPLTQSTLAIRPQISRRTKWILGGGFVAALVALVAFLNRKEITVLVDKAVAFGQEGLFAAALPLNVAKYAAYILVSARRYDVSPWALAGIMYRESYGGLALTPPGPGGTGDFAKRAAGWKSGAYTAPATGMPEDGRGWGRGLMQVDFGVHNDWVTTHNWADPAVNVDKGASLLAENMRFFQRPAAGSVTVASWRLTGYPTAKVAGWRTKYGLQSTGPFPDPRPLSGSALAEAAMAAYNAGTSGVLQALAAGLPASAPTAKNDYAAWIAERVGSWAAKFA